MKNIKWNGHWDDPVFLTNTKTRQKYEGLLTRLPHKNLHPTGYFEYRIRHKEAERFAENHIYTDFYRMTSEGWELDEWVKIDCVKVESKYDRKNDDIPTLMTCYLSVRRVGTNLEVLEELHG